MPIHRPSPPPPPYRPPYNNPYYYTYNGSAVNIAPAAGGGVAMDVVFGILGLIYMTALIAGKRTTLSYGVTAALISGVLDYFIYAGAIAPLTSDMATQVTWELFVCISTLVLCEEILAVRAPRWLESAAHHMRRPHFQAPEPNRAPEIIQMHRLEEIPTITAPAHGLQQEEIPEEVAANRRSPPPVRLSNTPALPESSEPLPSYSEDQDKRTHYSIA